MNTGKIQFLTACISPVDNVVALEHPPSHNRARLVDQLATWTQISTPKILHVLVNPVFSLHPLDRINCGWGQPAAQIRRCPLLARAVHEALLAGLPADPATKINPSSLSLTV